MAQAKITWTVRVLKDLDDQVENYIAENNLTKNAVVILALKKFLESES